MAQLTSQAAVMRPREEEMCIGCPATRRDRVVGKGDGASHFRARLDDPVRTEQNLDGIFHMSVDEASEALIPVDFRPSTFGITKSTEYRQEDACKGVAAALASNPGSATVQEAVGMTRWQMGRATPRLACEETAPA